MDFGAIFVFIIIIMILFLPPYIAYSAKRSRLNKEKSETIPASLLEEFKTIFVESSEQYITSLGNGYIVSFFNNGVLNSGYSIVTNKRVYFKGKCYLIQNGRTKKVNEERIVDLKDITGTGYTRINPIFILIMSLTCIVISLIMLIVAFINETDSSSVTFLILFVIGLILFSLLLTVYMLKKENFFEISFAGEGIAFRANRYVKDEMDEFQKQLRRAKDSIIESISNKDTSISYKQKTETTKIGIADEIQKYSDLKDKGVITQEEYQKLKTELITK